MAVQQRLISPIGPIPLPMRDKIPSYGTVIGNHRFAGAHDCHFGCGCPSTSGKASTKKLRLNTVDLSDPHLGWGQKIALAPIWLYQKLTRTKDGDNVGRTWLGKLISAHCPYDPSCSEYTADCIRKYGALQGIGKGMYRLFVMCNPLYFWFKGIKPEPRTIKHAP